MINEGVKGRVIAAPGNQVGAAVAGKAQARRIPTIDYDYGRLDLGGSADYLVSFDNVKAGDLQGRGLVRSIRALKVRGANIIEIDGPRTDPTSSLLAQGARNDRDRTRRTPHGARSTGTADIHHFGDDQAGHRQRGGQLTRHLCG